ncbi:MAG: hypothetical protein ACK4ZM_00135 [bacterium]
MFFTSFVFFNFGCSNNEIFEIKSKYNYRYFILEKVIKDIYEKVYKTDKHLFEVNVNGFDVSNEKFLFWGR